MQKNQLFDLARALLLLLTFATLVASNSARAESVNGRFFTGQVYSGEFSFSESSNADGMRVNPVSVRLTIDGQKNLLFYTYVADDLPTIRASDMGFLSIITNSGGMEGSVTYNYVIPNRDSLVSVGTVQTTLHLGKIEKIDVQPNKDLEKDEINGFIERIARFNVSALSEPVNAYPAAMLLLLGQGKYLTPKDDVNLSILYKNKEIVDDPILLRTLKRVICSDTQIAENTPISSIKTVIINKAYLFNSPTSSGIDRSYLIKGDGVSLVKKSDSGRYWLVDYVSSHGLRIEKWLRCEDIGYCR
ncbi:hypothetical protein [Paraburkholderia sp. J41]|uniref:hypothetical protein n=1 Tax=Paraburkholderia sp. J41 TaxID=2805433 RepID=UPI002AC343D0|nr:hypothetical protein [Paraburkholderia sp. J41]